MRWLLWVVPFLGFIVGCGSDECPDAEIRARFSAMAEAAEARDVGELADGIADDYRDLDGNTKDDIVLQMRRVLLLTRNLTVSTNVDALDVQTADFATATVRARVTDVDIRRLQIDGEGVVFELEWALNGGDWQIVSADWEPKHPLL